MHSVVTLLHKKVGSSQSKVNLNFLSRPEGETARSARMLFEFKKICGD